MGAVPSRHCGGTSWVGSCIPCGRCRSFGKCVLGDLRAITWANHHGNRHYNLEPSLIFFNSGVFIPYYTPIWDDFKSPPNGALMGWLWIIGRPTWPALRPQHGAEDEELRAQAPAPLPQLVRMMGMGWASMERSLMENLYV